jgi:hypothetical protein
MDILGYIILAAVTVIGCTYLYFGCQQIAKEEPVIVDDVL